jgi:hypothetical protein
LLDVLPGVVEARRACPADDDGNKAVRNNSAHPSGTLPAALRTILLGSFRLGHAGSRGHTAVETSPNYRTSGPGRMLRYCVIVGLLDAKARAAARLIHWDRRAIAGDGRPAVGADGRARRHQ